MNIYLTRHGQTNLNKEKLMQGLTDEPLNDVGINQAIRARETIGDVKFDKVFASPLERAIKTAEIIGNLDREKITIDERIIEVNFGEYEKKNYFRLGLPMTLYWALPEIFPAPKSVEPISLMVERTRLFMEDLEKKDYENVLIVCHGGIIRAISGYIEGKKNGIKWRPKAHNCEIRVYEYKNNSYRYIKCFNKK